MTSEAPAFVWTWLPGAVEPVIAGRVDQVGGELRFTYGRSYLRRSDAIPLQPDGLPLEAGQQRPATGLDAPGVIRDAAPDSWGMQVILRRRIGIDGQDTTALPLITYLLESGSNRIGALDFQLSSDEYKDRSAHGTLMELVEAGERLAKGLPFSLELDDALTNGTAVGGARPKALLVDGDRQLIAKFSVSTDTFPWMQAEAVGMELARRCGVDTASTTLTTAAGRDVLLVERFDRPGVGTRRSVLSALTLLGLHELAARYGSYVDLAEQIRLHFDAPDATLHQLFRRIVVNVLVGNTDDHPRNHAAFWDGSALTLTPAFDICPQPRSTGEAAQVMAFSANGERRARLAACVAAAGVFHLSEPESSSIVDECVTVLCDQYDDICTGVGASDATRSLLWRRAVANESVFYPLN
jgi:serine/threonine-protein kinase HipA